jgi:hypothetical protein
MSTTTSTKIQNSTDLTQFKNVIDILIKPLIQQKFSWLSLAYGDEINLHFGQENIKTFKSGRETKKGDWIFSTSASLWTLEKNNKILIDSNIFDLNTPTEDLGYVELEKQFAAIKNKKLYSFKLTEIDFELVTQLEFEDEYIFTAFSNPENTDLPNWKLFMPTEQVLIFNVQDRKPLWSCRSIHERY